MHARNGQKKEFSTEIAANIPQNWWEWPQTQPRCQRKCRENSWVKKNPWFSNNRTTEQQNNRNDRTTATRLEATFWVKTFNTRHAFPGSSGARTMETCPGYRMMPAVPRWEWQHQDSLSTAHYLSVYVCTIAWHSSTHTCTHRCVFGGISSP